MCGRVRARTAPVTCLIEPERRFSSKLCELERRYLRCMHEIEETLRPFVQNCVAWQRAMHTATYRECSCPRTRPAFGSSCLWLGTHRVRNPGLAGAINRGTAAVAAAGTTLPSCTTFPCFFSSLLFVVVVGLVSATRLGQMAAHDE